MLRRGASALAVALALIPLVIVSARGQTSAPPPVALSALIDQTVALFPPVEGDVVEVQGPILTLSLGRPSGVRLGLALEVYREGREIRHPRTGQILGRAEQRLGRAVVSQVFEGYSLAVLDGAEAVAVGDRVRLTSAKIRLTLMSLTGSAVATGLVEALTNEVYEGLTRTGRFQVVMGEQVALWLAQQKIGAEEFVQGKGVREAAERFKADNLMVIHLQMAQRRPVMDVRVFTAGRAEPVLATASPVPPSIKPVQPGRFSARDGRESPAPERRPRSLLARLLGGDLEAGTYSSGNTAIPLREVARFPFAVVSMDVTVAPVDQVPRLAVTDGERVYLYKIVNRQLEPEWTFWARSLGRVISVQLADLDGDGIVEVVVNRFDTRIGMSSLIVGLRNGKPAPLVDQVDAILYAVDDTGVGIRRTLWAQRFREESFFTKGQADRMLLRDRVLVKERPAAVPDQFRATGATFTNVMGPDGRALAYIDEHNRLRIATGTEEIWRSSSPVGGGGPKIEVVRYVERGGRSYFYHMEPVPLAVDLDGDGIQEIVVPQNQGETGVLGVIFRGPAGLRYQQVNSGFEGVIIGLGAVPGDSGDPPTLIAGVIRYKNILRTSGETQIIMTVHE